MRWFKSICDSVLGTLYRILEGARVRSRFAELQRSGAVTRGIHSYGMPSVHVFPSNHNRLTIGKYTSVADDVNVLLGGNHPTDWVSTFPFRIRMHMPEARQDGTPSSKGDVTIGSDVWIARDVLILSGITIGDGAVVAAGSVVVTNVPPYAIAGGVPARVLRYRFDPSTVETLLKIAWWNWPEAKVREAVPLLSSGRIHEFIEQYGTVPAETAAR